MGQLKRSLDVEATGQNKQLGKKLTRNREITTVLVSNLPKSYNQTKVRKYFQGCGTIAQVDICDTITRDSRLARIEFTNYNEVLSALTKTFNKVGNNEIQVRQLEDCTVWMTNFPPGFTHKDIKELLLSVGILSISVRLPSLRFNSNRRFAYVDVLSQSDVDTAVSQLNGKSVQNFNLVVKRSNLLEKSKRTDSSILERREIMVRHLDLDVITEDRLRNLFAAFGSIESIKIPGKQGGQQEAAYAFITFDEKSAADKALSASASILEENKLIVTLAERKAYLERQKVKRILSTMRQNDSIISLYPIDDRISKAQIESLFIEKVNLQKVDIKSIYLVTDHNGALIILKDAILAAKCTMALNGIEFKGNIVNCGSVKDLKKNNYAAQAPSMPSYSADKGASIANSEEKSNRTTTKLSNEDFRKLFLGK